MTNRLPGLMLGATLLLCTGYCLAGDLDEFTAALQADEKRRALEAQAVS